MTRYLLLVNFDGGVVDTPMDEWKPEEVAAHLDYYRALNKELRRDRRAGRGRSPGRARPGQDRDVRRRSRLRSSPTGRFRSSRSGSPVT